MTGEQELIKLYETAMKELYREIAYREGIGNSAAYQRRLLERVRTILKELRRKTPGAVETALKGPYRKGVERFVAEVQRATGFNLEPTINWRQLNILVQNTTDQLLLATNRVGRIWEDAIRRAGIEATQRKLATGQTVDQMRRQLLQELIGINPKGRDGQTGIITKRGTMRLDTYAALVARSTTAEAQNASQIDMAEQYGYDLARFTSHSPKCAKCAQFEGRVYALTKEAANGKYKGPDGRPLHFPYLYDTAFASGYNNIHPNCRHRLSIVVSTMLTPAELADLSRKSMRPFTDDRTERDRKAYAKAQAENRARWQDRRQWERYRATLPDQTPANFGAFRSMKRSGSQKWQDLQADYKYVAKASERGILKKYKGAVFGEGNPLAGLSKDSVIRTVAEIDKALEEYPGLREYVTELGVTDRGMMAVRPKDDFSGVVLMFGRECYSYPEKTEAAYAKDLQRGNSPAGTTWEQAGVHELGHVALAKIIGKRYVDPILRERDWNEDITAQEIVQKAWKNDGDLEKAIRSISNYASMSPSETIGEALLDVHANGKNAQQLSRLICEELKRWL